MATKIYKFKVGDRVKVTKASNEGSLLNKEGIIVSIAGVNQEIGVDFGIKIPGLTWDLNQSLATETGRFIKAVGLELVNTEWDI